MKVIVYLFYLS